MAMIDAAPARRKNRQIPTLAKERLYALNAFSRIRKIVNSEFEKRLAFGDLFPGML